MISSVLLLAASPLLISSTDEPCQIRNVPAINSDASLNGEVQHVSLVCGNHYLPIGDFDRIETSVNVAYNALVVIGRGPEGWLFRAYFRQAGGDWKFEDLKSYLPNERADYMFDLGKFEADGQICVRSVGTRSEVSCLTEIGLSEVVNSMKRREDANPRALPIVSVSPERRSPESEK